MSGVSRYIIKQMVAYSIKVGIKGATPKPKGYNSQLFDTPGGYAADPSCAEGSYWRSSFLLLSPEQCLLATGTTLPSAAERLPPSLIPKGIPFGHSGRLWRTPQRSKKHPAFLMPEMAEGV